MFSFLQRRKTYNAKGKGKAFGVFYSYRKVFALGFFACFLGFPCLAEVDFPKLFGTDEDALYDLLYATDDENWLIVQKTPAFVGSGRVGTEDLLFYLPEQRLIDIETFNSDLTAQGMYFANVFNEVHLIAHRKGTAVPVPVSLDALLRGEILDAPVYNKISANTQDEKILLELPLEKDKDSLSLGATSWQFQEAGVPKTLYAVASFAVQENYLYIVDAINFRVLVYDLEGAFVKTVHYPQKTICGKTVLMRDIVVDNKFIYLLAETGLYLVDAVTDDIAEIYNATNMPVATPYSFWNIEQCHSGHIYIFDYLNNIVFSFKREGRDLQFLVSEPYVQNSLQHFAEKQYAVSAIGQGLHDTAGRYFIVKKHDSSFVAIFDSGFKSCHVNLFHIDSKGNVYVSIENIADAEGQYPQEKMMSQISPQGFPLSTFFVHAWPGGPMNRSIVVTNAGAVYEAFFTNDESGEETVPTLVVRRHPF